MRHSRAFSLLLVLVLLCGLAALVTLLVALTPVASAERTVAAERVRLRQEAVALLGLALAEVQAAAGADQVATWMDGATAVASRRTPAGREEVRLSGERTLDGMLWRWRCEDISCGHDLAGEAMASSTQAASSVRAQFLDSTATGRPAMSPRSDAPARARRSTAGNPEATR